MTEATTKAATLTKRGAARARAGHPWIYRSDIADAAGDAGDVVRVVDRNGRFLGHAFYNPKSEITLRIATRQDEEITEAWFQDRIEKARDYRDSLRINADAYRLLHAEADGIPGLVADRYGDYLVLQVGRQRSSVASLLSSRPSKTSSPPPVSCCAATRPPGVAKASLRQSRSSPAKSPNR